MKKALLVLLLSLPFVAQAQTKEPCVAVFDRGKFFVLVTDSDNHGLYVMVSTDQGASLQLVTPGYATEIQQGVFCLSINQLLYYEVNVVNQTVEIKYKET